MTNICITAILVSLVTMALSALALTLFPKLFLVWCLLAFASLWTFSVATVRITEEVEK